MFSPTATKEALQAFYHCAIHPTPLEATPKPARFNTDLLVFAFFIIYLAYEQTRKNISSSRRFQTLELKMEALKTERNDLEEKLNAAGEEIKAAAEAKVAEKREMEADEEYEVLVDGKGA